MFSHVRLGADDVLAAKTFYDAVLGTLASAEGVIDKWGRVVYSTDAGRFLITQPINQLPATFANGGAIGFLAKTPDEVDAWYAAGLASGGSAIEDPLVTWNCSSLH